ITTDKDVAMLNQGSKFKQTFQFWLFRFWEDIIALLLEKIYVVNVLGAYSYRGSKAGYSIYHMNNADMLFGGITFVFNGAFDSAFKHYLSDSEGWEELMHKFMSIDFSWDTWASQYEELYQQSIAKARAAHRTAGEKHWTNCTLRVFTGYQMAQSSNVSSSVVLGMPNGHVSELPNGHNSQLLNGNGVQLPNVNVAQLPDEHVDQFYKLSHDHSRSVRRLAVSIAEFRDDDDLADGDAILGLLERLRLDNLEKAVCCRLMMKEVEVKIAEKNICIGRLRRNGAV
ncbi:hypothetical protein Tco_1516682, partial [Tanacetum coccineum]